MRNITTLFLDIGGVLLTNGWDHLSRELAAKIFNLDFEEMQDRHVLNFDTYETGKMSLEDYLQRVVFYKKRPFTQETFKKFMFAQSKPYNEMIQWISSLKTKHHLKIIVVSNEARELNDYRIKKFKLSKFVDSFISSCYVHLKKPDVEIYKLALDVSGTPLKKILYIDDRKMFIDVAKSLGIRSLHHIDYESTRKLLTP